MQGAGCRVQGAGCRVKGAEFSVWCLGLRGEDSRCKVSGLGFRV